MDDEKGPGLEDLSGSVANESEWRRTTKQRFALYAALVLCVSGLQASVRASPIDEAAVMSTAGRNLPEPEFLQPRLDPELPLYLPCPQDEIKGRLLGSAPAIMPRLVGNWLQAFQRYYPRANVRVPPPYLAPQGALSPPMQAFLDGRSDFAFVSRDLAASDIAAFERVHGFEPLAIPVAAGAYRHFGFIDAVAVIVNRANPVEQMSFEQLDAVFSKSRLRGRRRALTWGDLGVIAWADRPVHVVGATAWNGDESARAVTMRKRVLSLGSQRGQWRDDLPSVGSEADVPEQVAADSDAIGFTGMGHLLDGVKPIALASGDEATFYEPTYENIARADYPLTRVAYLVVAKKPDVAVDPTLRELVHFLLSKEGQRIVLDQGVLLPLRAKQVTAARSLFDQGEGASECARQPKQWTP